MRPVAPMPWGAAVDTNGLKSRVTLFSGELSMTSVAPVVLVVVVAELLDEQAARPAARSIAATSASALLLDLGLIVTSAVLSGIFIFDFPPEDILRGWIYHLWGETFTFGGITRACGSTAEGPPEVTGGPSHRSAGNPLILCWLCYETALRCSRTYSSVPEPGPLLVPDGWHESYGFAWVGQPV